MHSAQFVQLAGARVSIKKGEAHITLPVRKELYHAAGAMHGALYFLALDNAAFFAANSLVEDVFVLNLQRAILQSSVRGCRLHTASPFRHGAAYSMCCGLRPWTDRRYPT